MATRSFSFSSESVTEGHPDKIADQISDSVLDAVLKDDVNGRVACETLITTGLVVVAGEMTTETWVDIRAVVRERIAEIGYTRAKYGFDFETCGVVVAIDEQSADIALGVDESFEAKHGDTDPLDLLGAGDQGMMFGYATRETEELMPLPILLAHKITKRLAEVRKANVLPYLRPDGKSQVTVRYEVDEHGIQRPVQIERVLISTQHRDGLDIESLLKPDLLEHVVEPILHADYRGLYVAKNVVAAGLADRCQLQVAYAIGVSHPMSVNIECFGTETVPLSTVEKLVSENFDLRPGAIIRDLDLQRPIYAKTASYGHFGRDDRDFTWERTDKAAALREAAGLLSETRV